MSAWENLEQYPSHRHEAEQHRHATLFLQLAEPNQVDLEYNTSYEHLLLNSFTAEDQSDQGPNDNVINSEVGIASQYKGRLHEDFLGEKMLSLLTELNFSGNNPSNLDSIRKYYLQYGAYLDFQDEMLYHKSALLLAASFGHDVIIELLLEQGANLELEDEDGNTALLLAANNGYESILQILLKHSVNINHQNNDGFTALALACLGGYDNCVELLLLLGADPDISIRREDRKGCSALMLAAEQGFLTIVELLFMFGADIEKVNDMGYTALFVAFLESNYDVVRFLIQHCHAKLFINPKSIHLRKITAKIRTWMNSSR